MAGAILAGGLALGECKAFRFVEKPSGQCLTALPPEELGRKKPNRGPIKFRKRENWGLIEVKSEQEQLGETCVVTYSNDKNSNCFLAHYELDKCKACLVPLRQPVRASIRWHTTV